MKYSYKDSIKIMLIPYIILMIIWLPMSLVIQNYTQDHLVSQVLMLILTTTFIFCLALYFDNSSLYDPYWQCAPIFLLGYWQIQRDNFIIPLLGLLYSIKQNYTYFRFWPGLQFEDYRNEQIRKNSHPIVFWLTMYFGFELVPSFMTFFGHLPAYYAIHSDTCHPIFYTLSIFITLIAIIIEFVADYQLFPFRTHQKSGNCEIGLWKYSRHPNYFGECLYWWGLFLCGVSCGTFSIWGALTIQALFSLFSIPDMEKHLLSKRPSYADYQKRVSKFIPWFN